MYPKEGTAESPRLHQNPEGDKELPHDKQGGGREMACAPPYKTSHVLTFPDDPRAFCHDLDQSSLSLAWSASMWARPSRTTAEYDPTGRLLLMVKTVYCFLWVIDVWMHTHSHTDTHTHTLVGIIPNIIVLGKC